MTDVQQEQWAPASKGDRPRSESVVTATALSFTGSKQRIDNLWPGNKWIGWASLLIPLVWSLVLTYYSVAWLWIWFTWPVRLLSRGKRKRKREEQRHRELMEQMERSSR